MLKVPKITNLRTSSTYQKLSSPGVPGWQGWEAVCQASQVHFSRSLQVRLAPDQVVMLVVQCSHLSVLHILVLSGTARCRSRNNQRPCSTSIVKLIFSISSFLSNEQLYDFTLTKYYIFHVFGYDRKSEYVRIKSRLRRTTIRVFYSSFRPVSITGSP